jgi:hypothetical protein
MFLGIFLGNVPGNIPGKTGKCSWEYSWEMFLVIFPGKLEMFLGSVPGKCSQFPGNNWEIYFLGIFGNISWQRSQEYSQENWEYFSQLGTFPGNIPSFPRKYICQYNP